MGIDYFNCQKCDEIFSDCGTFGMCMNCENLYCEDCEAK